MSTFNSACTHCGQHIEHPADMTGEIIKCPNCGKETLLGSDSRKHDPLDDNNWYVAAIAILVVFLMAIFTDQALALQIAGVLLLLVGVAIYFLPTLIAWRKQNRNLLALGLLNFFLGWTLLG